MTIAITDQPGRTNITSKTDTLETKNDASSPSEASEFGQVMSQAMTQQGKSALSEPSKNDEESAPELALTGQELAEAQAAGNPGMAPPDLFFSLGGNFLKAVHLGAHLNVITPENGAPNEQSLEAFARAQGLDETAVQWLMGAAPAATVVASGPVMASLASAVNLTEMALSSAAVNSAATTHPSASATTAAALPPSLGQLSANSAEPTDPQATSKADLALTSSALANAALNSAALTSAALWAMGTATDKAQQPKLSEAVEAEMAKLQINLQPPAAPTALWLLRNQLLATAAKESANAAKAAVSLSELDLSPDFSAELLDSLGLSAAEGAGETSQSGQPSPMSSHLAQRIDPATAARQAAASSEAGAAGPELGSAQRSENIQNLAEKMGQAVGQRMLSEMERGQWHLKLSLRPATLGHIEVEMRMRSGEMDAIFTAPQALTRELLQDGMAKLKDTLSNMGMNVASMQVGDGQARQGGGESTPGKPSNSAKSEENDSQSTAIQSVSPPRIKMGQDGWDVLV